MQRTMKWTTELVVMMGMMGAVKRKRWDGVKKEDCWWMERKRGRLEGGDESRLCR